MATLHLCAYLVAFFCLYLWYDSEDLTYDVIVPFDDDLRITSDVIDAILISGLFSGMFYAEYLFIQWLSTYALLGHTP